MEADRDSAFVGEEIAVFGRLTSQGSSLPGRRVTIESDQGRLASAITGEGGYYRATFGIPYSYAPGLTLWASYVPRGEDTASLRAARSAPVRVKVLFYQTGLEASWPPVGYPGLPLEVTGAVSSSGEGPPPLRRLRVLFDGQPLAEAEATGSFQIEVVPPVEATLGRHTLRVEVASHLRYAGTSREGSLNLQLMPTTLQVRVPYLALAPGKLLISGRVSSPRGVLSQPQVRLVSGVASTEASVTAEGGFTAELRLPLALTLFGPKALVVLVTPGEPWQAPATARARVFIINIADLGLLLLGVSALAGVLAVRRRPRPAQPGTVAPRQVAPAPVEEPVPPPPPVDSLGRVFRAYEQATAIVSRRAGVSLAPAITLREFLHQVRPVLGDAEAAYAGLTRAAETALYSGYSLGEGEAAAAEALARQVVEVLTGGTV